jgi:PQQ-dependent dehydrogenase (methanol/ethanol family)
MSRRGAWLQAVGVLAAVGVLLVTSGASAQRTDATGDVNWASWGNTVDQNRYSPLTQISSSNVSQLGRAFTVDLNKFVPGIKKGQQTYPIVIDGVMYITSGDDQVFAVNATNGSLIWHYAPDNVATFKNFGIVANRGVSYCDGRIYLLTLDMTIVELDPATGNLIARVPISRYVPGAQSNYGYSETSVPICYDHKLIFGAAGSEYGARGFVEALKTGSLAPAWANPFWTIPPDDTEWRKDARIVGGGVVWTPVTVDPTTNTLYFGTGAATPPYYPSLRPGPDPRADSIIALNVNNGTMKWWQQQLSSNEWSYDTSQPPMVYTAKVGGKTQRIVSVATMEGVWFAYNAATGAPIWQRVKVIDNVEHPNLKPGQPVVIYPSSLGGLNFSPASFDPQTGYVYNAAAETASVLVQQNSAEVEKQALLAGDVFLGLANGDYGQYLQTGWKDYGSVSAIDVNTGTRVWKFATPQPERGGPTMTASGIGFVGGGDGNLRVFDATTGQVLWTFQTGAQIADGPSVYSVNGTEYVAIGVGGTPTSSSGGTVASQVQVFDLGGSQTQSTAPTIAGTDIHVTSSAAAAPTKVAAPLARVVHLHASTSSAVRVTGPTGLSVKQWDPNSTNLDTVQGRVTLSGQPVKGVELTVDGWLDPSRTDSTGSFDYPLDVTTPGRHLAKIVDVSHATINGTPLSKAQGNELLGKTGGISIGYDMTDLSAKPGAGGTVVVTGKMTYGDEAPPTVLLYSYELQGTITDSNGNPVKGAIVTTRTNDRQYWTQSRPSGANGKFASFLVAADQEGDNPVPMEVGIAVGSTSYAEPAADEINFAKLQSATLNVQLPANAATGLVKTTLNPVAMPGAIYQGLLVGVVGGRGGVIQPVSASWPDANGSFKLVLPSSAAGQTVQFWQDSRQFFSADATTPGGSVDLSVYPKRLPSDAPQAVATLKLPG